jgi:hypothetical protein
MSRWTAGVGALVDGEGAGGVHGPEVDDALRHARLPDGGLDLAGHVHELLALAGSHFDPSVHRSSSVWWDRGPGCGESVAAVPVGSRSGAASPIW